MRALDLTGQRFNKLVAVELVQTKPTKWKCLCDCGNYTEVLRTNLKKKQGGTKSCGCALKSDIPVEIGTIFETTNCGKITIAEKLEGDYVTAKFEDGTTVRVSKGNVRNGSVWNPNKPTVFGKGFCGQGKYKQTGTKLHSYWYAMMTRAYSLSYKEKHPTYEEVTVCEEWHNFQNFAEWCVKQKNFGLNGMNLDKDILVKNNKEYSPETCCLIPQQVNKVIMFPSTIRDLPPGVKRSGKKFRADCCTENDGTYLGLFLTEDEAFAAYKIEKKKQIVKVAEAFRNQLDDNVFEALLNFEIIDNRIKNES